MLQNKFVIVRSIASGIFAGTVESTGQGSISLSNSRQIIEWECEPTLSHIARNGFMMPESVKMSPKIEFRLLEHVTEVITCTERAKESIEIIPDSLSDGKPFNNYYGFGIAELYTTEERTAMQEVTENEVEKFI